MERPGTQVSRRASRLRARAPRRAIIGAAVGAVVLVAACGAGPGGATATPAPGGVPPTPAPNPFLGILPQPPAPTPTPTPQPVVLHLAHWQTGAVGRVLATLAKQFQQSAPGIVVQPTVLPFGAHFVGLAGAFAGGNPPDVFLESGAYVFDHLKARALLDLSSQIGADRLDLDLYWTEPIIRPVGGSSFTLPLWVDDELVYYNRDLLAGAGVAEPDESWTWSDFLAAAQRSTQGKPGETTQWGLLLTNDVSGGWGSFVASNGGRWLDPAVPRTSLDEPAAVEALRFVVDTILAHHAAPRPTEQQALTHAGQIDPFLGGQVAMLPNGTWEMSALLQQARFRWDVARLPRAPRTGRSVSVASVQPIAVARQTQHPAEAWQLGRFLIDPEAQRAWIPGKTRLPALKSLGLDAANGYAAPPPARVAVAPRAMDDARDLQFVANWRAWRAAVVNALQPAFDGRVPLADAIRQAVTAGDAALKGK